jgi:flagellar basal-body rod modification protein FlgD
MTVSATASTTAATQDTTALGRTQLAQSFDTFLSLLTTQMKNQDPLAPMDSTQFTQQLVQMTGVEQQLATNDLLKQLVANSNASVASAVGLIGKQVAADISDAQLSGGKAQWTYTLSKAAADVKIEVLDANGATVKAAAAPASANTAGEHTYTWDGVNDFGNKLADGTYTLRITAKDAGGQVVDATTHVQGLVSAIQELNGQPVVAVNGVKVPLALVSSITEPASTAASNASAKSSPNPDGQTSSPSA